MKEDKTKLKIKGIATYNYNYYIQLMKEDKTKLKIKGIATYNYNYIYS